MNKKVLTLCAGVLLVGGSAVFTVNAVNAGNGKAEVVAYAAQADEVAGYKLITSDNVQGTAWWLAQSGENYYITVKGKDGKAGDWYLDLTDGLIKKVPADGKVAFVTLGKDGKLSLKGQTVYLWDEKGGKITEFTTSGNVNLATKEQTPVAYTQNTHVVAYIGSALEFSTYNSSNGATHVNWTLSANGLLSCTYNSSTYYLKANEDGTLTSTTDATEANNFTFDGENLKIGDKIVYMVVAGTDGKNSKLTTNVAEGEEEDAYSVVLFNVEGTEAIGEAQTEAVTEGGTFIIAQAIKKDVASKDKISYVEVAGVVAGAPGAEYGTIEGVTFLTDGTLEIFGEVTTAKVPVFIYYKNGDKKVYLTTNGWKEGDANATAWILVDGVLTTLAGDEPYKDVTYTPTGITGVGSTVGDNVIYELAQQSISANEIDKCELPLLSASEMDYNDYVILGGETAPGAYFYLVQERGQQASFLQYTNRRITNETALWKVTKQKLNDGRYSYIFTNRETGEDLNINGYKRFIAYNYNGGVQLLGVDVNGVNEASVVVDGVRGLHTSTAAATTIGFYRSQTESYTAHWLLHRYGSSFQLNFSDYKDYANKTWMGNEFNGNDLVPVVWNGTNLIEISSDEYDTYAGVQAFLLKKRGTNLYIALNVDKKWTNVVTDLINTGGYKFELLSEENVKKVVRSNEPINGDHYMAYFRINYLEGETEYKASNDGHDIINNDLVDPKKMDPYCIEVGPDGTTWSYDIIIVETDDKGGNGHKDLFVTVNDRCENDDRKPTVSFYDVDENIVRGEDAQNNPLNYRYVNIAFKAGAQMQFNNGNNWVNLNGKVLGINEAGTRALPTEKEYFLFDKAEGQWAVSMTDAENGTSKDDIDTRKFTFTNRENPAISIDVTSMHYMGENTYAVEYAYNYGTFGAQTVNGSHYAVTRDTLVITPAKGNLKLTAGKDAFNNDSYAKWTKEDLQDKTFQLSIDAAAQLYVTENEGKDSHFLGLTDDALEVTNWRLVPFTAARVHDVDAAQYLTAGTDSVYTMSHPQYYSGGKFYNYNDTTAIVAYALQNIANNEWLRYDPSQSQTILSMICDPNSKNYTTADLNEAYRFVLKEKAEGAQAIESGAYNILGVNAWEFGADKYVEGNAYYTLDLSKKLYGATSYQKLGAVEVEKAYNQPTSNDIFTIATTASQEYVLATPRDTVRIYGAEENDFLLYENGQFLNLGNKGDIAPAMVLDTAYIRQDLGNNRYQYLLVVNPNYVPAEYDSHPDHTIPHLLSPDTMYGRFLVNQIDSAVFVSRNHNNKFINDIEADEKEVKLGFQWGYHTGDALYLTEGEGKNSPVIEKIELGTPDFNKAKFAFKYVNEAAGDDFKVQTAWYDYDSAVKAGLDNKEDWTWNNEGYLKSVNGVIVVTNGYTHGEEFLMAQDETNPTANETIAAEGAISVVATDGAVIIKGAEGKNVVIATILGKVVANETVNSDNETIAVPAGIAVVSVDGESFKVVVK